ncbi:hypothetical protein EMEDMD4_1010016 [Sinorhizobium medicae]|uniref:Uncharacterized protein n=1 Tax=Sinorhizobium medicae TaxID=110321 RepID=A0A508WQZ7_9HYPH|nr:hypothetical protein EMEDMD4_1010016 [Sinorhizobium medicae]
MTLKGRISPAAVLAANDMGGFNMDAALTIAAAAIKPRRLKELDDIERLHLS